MALNFCVICDDAFSETKNNPGNVCPDCNEEIESRKRLEQVEADKRFEDYLFDRADRNNEFV